MLLSNTFEDNFFFFFFGCKSEEFPSKFECLSKWRLITKKLENENSLLIIARNDRLSPGNDFLKVIFSIISYDLMKVEIFISGFRDLWTKYSKF